MRSLAILATGVVAALGLSFAGLVPGAEPAADAQEAATITIDQFQYNPAELQTKANTPITVTNNDDFPHTVTAEDGSFDVTVPAKGSATVTVAAPGNYPYMCTLHPGQHNPASITAS